MVDEIIYIGGDDNLDELLDLEETWEFSGVYTTTDDDPDTLENTANVSGMDALEKMVTASASASVSVLEPFVPIPGIALVKTAEPVEVNVGDNVTYTYTVTNTGNVPLANITLIDDKLPGDISYESGDENGDELLNNGEEWVFEAIYTTSVDDLGTLVNYAEASGTYAPEQMVTASASASVSVLEPFIPTPGIALVKTAEPLEVYVGDRITYTYTVTNTGNVPLGNITLIDDPPEDITYISGDDNGDGFLDVEETWVFRAFHEVCCCDPSPLVNTAEVSGTDDQGQTVTASDSASVTILSCYE
jgi:uncharacterized repeat protein (TIGR01451 family)